jgi:hypothetical protein
VNDTLLYPDTFSSCFAHTRNGSQPFSCCSVYVALPFAVAAIGDPVGVVAIRNVVVLTASTT